MHVGVTNIVNANNNPTGIPFDSREKTKAHRDEVTCTWQVSGNTGPQTRQSGAQAHTPQLLATLLVEQVSETQEGPKRPSPPLGCLIYLLAAARNP